MTTSVFDGVVDQNKHLQQINEREIQFSNFLRRLTAKAKLDANYLQKLLNKEGKAFSKGQSEYESLLISYTIKLLEKQQDFANFIREQSQSFQQTVEQHNRQLYNDMVQIRDFQALLKNRKQQQVKLNRKITILEQKLLSYQQGTISCCQPKNSEKQTLKLQQKKEQLEQALRKTTEKLVILEQKAEEYIKALEEQNANIKNMQYELYLKFFNAVNENSKFEHGQVDVQPLPDQQVEVCSNIVSST